MRNIITSRRNCEYRTVTTFHSPRNMVLVRYMGVNTLIKGDNEYKNNNNDNNNIIHIDVLRQVGKM